LGHLYKAALSGISVAIQAAFTARYPGILKALARMPDETVIDGEVVALDPDGRPSFNLLQNYGSAGVPLHFFVFDILILKGEDVMSEPLVKRRQLLEKHVLPKLDEPIRYSPILEGSVKDLLGLRGVIEDTLARLHRRSLPGTRGRLKAGGRITLAIFVFANPLRESSARLGSPLAPEDVN
jgi:bifunctional non-homologous end joining protein LigD